MEPVQQLGRTLLLLGAVLIVVGAFLYFGGKLPFRLGRLPGDIVVERPGFRFFLPVTTMILTSLVLSLLLWLLRK